MVDAQDILAIVDTFSSHPTLRAVRATLRERHAEDALWWRVFWELNQVDGEAGPAFRDCADLSCPEMVPLPGGMDIRFGGNPSGPHAPRGAVAIAPFALSATPVTHGQWRAVMGASPSAFPPCADDCLVGNVTLPEAQAFVAKLSAKTGHTYRLPTEAEWEFACIAGQRVVGFCTAQAPKPVPQTTLWEHAYLVGHTKPNPWGIYIDTDISEWTSDCSDTTCRHYVTRGADSLVGSAVRWRTWKYAREGSLGFRVARDNQSPGR